MTEPRYGRTRIFVSTFETDMNDMLFSDYPEIVDSLAVNEELF